MENGYNGRKYREFQQNIESSKIQWTSRNKNMLSEVNNSFDRYNNRLDTAGDRKWELKDQWKIQTETCR